MRSLLDDGRHLSSVTRTRELLALMRTAPLGTHTVGRYSITLSVESRRRTVLRFVDRGNVVGRKRHNVHRLTHLIGVRDGLALRVGDSIRFDSTTGEIWHTGAAREDHPQSAVPVPAEYLDTDGVLLALILPTVGNVRTWCESNAYDLTPDGYHNGRKVWSLCDPGTGAAITKAGA